MTVSPASRPVIDRSMINMAYLLKSDSVVWTRKTGLLRSMGDDPKPPSTCSTAPLCRRGVATLHPALSEFTAC